MLGLLTGGAAATAGVRSSMMGSNPFTRFLSDLSSGVAGGVAGNIVGSQFDVPRARRGGKAARSYMESAYPELNPWEMAGVPGAVSQGTAVQQGASAAALQQRSLDTQERIAEKNNATALLQTKMQTEPAHAKLPHEIQMMEKQMLGIDATTNQTQAQTVRTVQGGITETLQQMNLYKEYSQQDINSAIKRAQVDLIKSQTELNYDRIDDGVKIPDSYTQAVASRSKSRKSNFSATKLYTLALRYLGVIGAGVGAASLIKGSSPDDKTTGDPFVDSGVPD